MTKLRMPKLRTACLVATQGRLEQIKAMTVDAPVMSLEEARIYGIPVYRCDNDVDVMLRALELAKTTDEVWMAMDAGDQLVLMPSWIRDMYHKKGGEG